MNEFTHEVVEKCEGIVSRCKNLTRLIDDPTGQTPDETKQILLAIAKLDSAMKALRKKIKTDIVEPFQHARL